MKLLQQLKSFKCLGHVITEGGKCETEINIRIGMAKTNNTQKNTCNRVRKILTSKQVSQQQKLHIIKCYLYSIFLYGAEDWTLNKSTEKKIQVPEMWIYGRVGHVKWTEKKTKEEMLDKLELTREIHHNNS